MKKAFTLIELLVVIAIIAILAAILFPVFAQAKAAAKKTAALSNVKQMGTGFAVYLADSDDVYPMAFSRRASGTWRYGTVHPTPANVVNAGGWDSAEVVAQSQCQWANSVQPYIKSWDLYDVPGTGKYSFDATFTPGVRPARTALTMNGLFHAWSATAVDNPSVAILAWQGTGSNAIEGRSMANPSLDCGTGPGDCKFNPTGPASSDAGATGTGATYGTAGGGNAWLYGKSTPMVRADTSAKSVQIGMKSAPAAHAWPAVNSDPWAQVSASGVPASFWSCGPNGEGDWRPGANYPCYFRPDRTR